MSDDLKRFAASRRGDSGPIRVFVEIAAAAPDEACLARLTELGLAVDRVVGNKVLGRVAAERVPALEADPDVRLVERSKGLGKHGDPW